MLIEPLIHSNCDHKLTNCILITFTRNYQKSLGLELIEKTIKLYVKFLRFNHLYYEINLITFDRKGKKLIILSLKTSRSHENDYLICCCVQIVTTKTSTTLII